MKHLGSGAIRAQTRVSTDLIFLYDQILESTSRLLDFSNSVYGDDDDDDLGDVASDVAHVAGLLAKKEMLAFAASVRNFGELTNSVDKMKEYKVILSEIYVSNGPPFFRDTKKTIHLYQGVSRVLHSNETEVLKRPESFILATHHGPVEEMYESLVRERRNFPKQVDAMVIISTKKEGISAFRLKSLLNSAMAYVGTIVGELADKQIFLERSIRDA